MFTLDPVERRGALLIFRIEDAQRLMGQGGRRAYLVIWYQDSPKKIPEKLPERVRTAVDTAV